MPKASDPTCAERVTEHMESRLEDLQKFYQAAQEGKEEVKNLGNVDEYGLCFDYIPAETYKNQDEGYFSWQLSWGGPSDEFRIFVDASLHCHRIEYWFLDWFDGAHIVLTGKDRKLVDYFVDRFRELDVMTSAIERAK